MVAAALFLLCPDGQGECPATHLVQGEDDEGSSAAGVDDHAHELGVDGAEVAVPCHLGDADVIVTLVSFQGLTKDVTELAAPHNLLGHG